MATAQVDARSSSRESDSHLDVTIDQMEVCHFVGGCHAHELLAGLNEHRLAGRLCDITICCDGSRLSCHKIVLAAFSPQYFKVMFSEKFSEGQQNEVTISGVDSSAMSMLIDYAYTSKVLITKFNVHSLLCAADLFGISHIRNVCCHFMKKCMDQENCLELVSMADMYACIWLRGEAKLFTLNHLATISKQEDFLNLTHHKLVQLFTDKGPKKGRLLQEDVFRAIVHWVEHEPKCRSPNFDTLVEHVELPWWSLAFLLGMEKQHPIVKESQMCQHIAAGGFSHYFVTGSKLFFGGP